MRRKVARQSRPSARVIARVADLRPLASANASRRYSATHSHVVSLLKLVLPAAAVGLVGLVLLWPQISPLDQKFRLRPVTLGIEDLENLRMVSPRLVGTDSQNQPYTITAEQATQQAGNSSITDLVRPKGDLMLNTGAWLALTADSGTYRKDEQSLELNGNVNMFHDGGYEIVTSRAHLDLAQGNAAGDEPVVGHGPDVELEGQGFRIFNKGARIVVTGRSRLVLQPAPADRQ